MGFQINHKNEVKTDNRIKNLEILTHQQNIEKSKSKAIISFNIQTGEEKLFVSIKSESIELNINVSSISRVCNKVTNRKSASTKKWK